MFPRIVGDGVGVPIPFIVAYAVSMSTLRFGGILVAADLPAVFEVLKVYAGGFDRIEALYDSINRDVNGALIAKDDEDSDFSDVVDQLEALCLPYRVEVRGGTCFHFDGVERVSSGTDYSGRAEITLGRLEKAKRAGGTPESYVSDALALDAKLHRPVPRLYICESAREEIVAQRELVAWAKAQDDPLSAINALALQVSVGTCGALLGAR
jgi:hypothetical protein